MCFAFGGFDKVGSLSLGGRDLRGENVKPNVLLAAVLASWYRRRRLRLTVSITWRPLGRVGGQCVLHSRGSRRWRGWIWVSLSFRGQKRQLAGQFASTSAGSRR